MKILIIPFFVPLFILAQSEIISPSVQEKINKAKDFYDVSLFEESKTILVELLYSEEGKNSEVEIRYQLGLASYYEGKFQDAMIQWKQVMRKYPTSERSRKLNRVLDNYISDKDSLDYFKLEEFEYGNDIKRGLQLWTPIYINQKLLWGELKNPERATVFYQRLIDKYDDPEKKFALLYYYLLLTAGFNSDNYGYENQPQLTHTNREFYNTRYLFKIDDILKEMENQISGEVDQKHGKLVQAYYLCGVRISGSALFSGKVIVNNKSEKYFNKVIELTVDDENNIYRIFSEHWLNKK